VVNCLRSTAFEAIYVVIHDCGRHEAVDGVEVVLLEDWLDWMRATAS
jgi:hypothetical protein